MALSTMYKAKPNSPQTTLAADISAADTSMTVADATVLPTAPNLCTIGDDENAEVVSYTTITGNVVSGLIRGSSGTTASVWTAGTPIARDFTSYDHDTFIDNINNLNTEKAPTASPSFTGNPTAPTQATSNNSTRLATTAFVQVHVPIHITANVSAGTTVTISDNRITSTMTVINCWFSYPERVASAITWVTSDGSITLTSNFSYTNIVSIDLIEAN